MAMDGLHHRQKTSSTLLSHGHPESSTPITPLSSRKLSVDPFAQSLSAPNFVTAPLSAATIPNFDDYSLPPSTQTLQTSQMYEPWDLPPGFEQVHHPSTAYNTFNDTATHTMTKDDNIGFQRDVDLAVPRSFERYNFGMNDYNALSLQNLEPGAYMTDFDTSNEFGYEKSRNATPYLLIDDIGNIDQFSVRGSPKMELEFNSNDGLTLTETGLPKSPPSQATKNRRNNEREITGSEVHDVNLEEPYAKLIYRALMSAPNHSMVLQEIYQWFRDNTTKGSSDSKGWMNSIRHNLSMNAAFKKTETKLSGDEGKKSTEWVLEDFAIKDGVQSTTRYRKGTASKMAMRSVTPARNRQLSGRKGGISSSRGGRQRKEDRLESRLRMPQLDAPQRPYLQTQALSRLSQRQRSPYTPPDPGFLDSSLFCVSKGGNDGLPYDARYRFEDVQGVLIEDCAVFTSDAELGFYGCHGLPTYDQRP